ncbi:GNAT family N-acetyltransferase [Gottfriedia acidiceleris]|uniref:GNAT family N-acetyltransferase n=1 Tax=Gottfriedia acidiceleris TaxID=371036 RepID=UPI0030004C75
MNPDGLINIRQVLPSDIPIMHKWECDDEIGKLVGIEKPRSLDEMVQGYEKYFDGLKPNLHLFTIEYNGICVGRIELGNLDQENNHAAFGIVIGDQSMQNKGIGSFALNYLLNYAFNELKLIKIYGEVYEYNIASQKFLTKLGFHLDGILRKHEFFKGAHRDMYQYSMLKEEFNSSKV